MSYTSNVHYPIYVPRISGKSLGKYARMFRTGCLELTLEQLAAAGYCNRDSVGAIEYGKWSVAGLQAFYRMGFLTYLTNYAVAIDGGVCWYDATNEYRLNPQRAIETNLTATPELWQLWGETLGMIAEYPLNKVNEINGAKPYIREWWMFHLIEFAAKQHYALRWNEKHGISFCGDEENGKFQLWMMKEGLI